MLGIASLSHAGSAAAPRLEQSRININAVAANVSAESVQGGKSTSRSSFGKKKKTATGDGQAKVDVGVLEITGAASVKRSEININAVAGGIHARGATVRVGTVSAGAQ
jgi:hypothetical protein